MAQCPFCGAPDAYNSGFTVECMNTDCSHFSESHRKACLGKVAASSSTFEQDRVLVVLYSPGIADGISIFSTGPVWVEYLNSKEGTISFSRFTIRANDPHYLPVLKNVEVEITAGGTGESLVQLVLKNRKGEEMYTDSVILGEETTHLRIKPME